MALKGCVLSAVLFLIYTNALRSRFDNCVLIKYADDTVLLGLITNNDENIYKTQIVEITQWCQSHHLWLNVAKLIYIEIIFDFRHSSITHIPLLINIDPVKICETFKYLGITTDNKLTCSKHCATLVSKCRQRLFFKLLN